MTHKWCFQTWTKQFSAFTNLPACSVPAIMSKSIVNQEAPGAAVKRSCDSDTATMLVKTRNTIVNQAQGAAVKRKNGNSEGAKNVEGFSSR